MDLEPHGQAGTQGAQHVLHRAGCRVLHVKTRRLAHVPAMIPAVYLTLQPSGPTHAALPAVVARLLISRSSLRLCAPALADKVLVMRRIGRPAEIRVLG